MMTGGKVLVKKEDGTWAPVGNGTVILNNVAASTWVADTTYAEYGYRCTVASAAISATDFVDVVFGVTEATSGDYAPVCEAYDGGVYLYSKVDDAIIVPTITIMKGVSL